MILAVTIWSMKLDIITANVIKGFIIFLATPFSLVIFIMNDQVDYAYGLWHGLGNILGAMLASHFAMSWGVKFVRLFTMAILVVCFADLVGLISLKGMMSAMLEALNL